MAGWEQTVIIGNVGRDPETKFMPSGNGSVTSFTVAVTTRWTDRNSQEKKERVMQNISVENARWIGALLAQLSDEQLRDAFRAAHYDEQTMNGFVAVIRDRINQLNHLNESVAVSK